MQAFIYILVYFFLSSPQVSERASERKANLKLLVAKQLESIFFLFFTASVIYFSTNLALFSKISSHYLFTGK